MKPTRHQLLLLARAAAGGGPVPQTRYRHQGHALGGKDPVLWFHALTHQGEPFTFGGLALATIDPATGGITDLELFVTDHPLDQAATTAAFHAFAGRFTAHLDGPFLARTEPDGRPVDPRDRKTPPDTLPRIVVTGSETMKVAARLGDRFSGEHGGRWLRESAEKAKFAGQSLVVDVSSQLNAAFVVPLPSQEQAHLAAAVAAVTGGPSAAWAAEQTTLGPAMDLVTADALWEGHEQLRAARKDGRQQDAARHRADLERVYRQVAVQAAQATTTALGLLDRLDAEPRFAERRRREDEKHYLDRASFLHGDYGGQRRPVGTISRNAKELQQREAAIEIHELRRLATDPIERCQRWGLGEIVEGVRTQVHEERIGTGGFTPTGRERTTVAVDIESDLIDRVHPPTVGSRVLWAGDDTFQTEGIVTAIDDRRVTVRVVGSRKVLRPAESGYDVWVTARPPFTAPAPVMHKDQLPLTHVGGDIR